VVGTPIGNLEDVSYRAILTLKKVDFVICEDTRVTKRLLDRYGINRPLLSYHQHSKISRINEIIDRLKSGKSAAMVSDAGTPGISDPGGQLVAAARDEGVNVKVIPGPSALTAAISVSGLPMDKFIFIGFLPHKKGRETLFKTIADSKTPIVFYESTHRIIKTLKSLSSALAEDRKVLLAKELTKMNENILSGSAKDILEEITMKSELAKGEFVVIVSGK
jgi:16S rRNA (cytidine1402-2'-O)-methyltransferase